MTVVSPLATIFNGSVTATPERFFPKSIAKIRPMLQRYCKTASLTSKTVLFEKLRFGKCQDNLVGFIGKKVNLTH